MEERQISLKKYGIELGLYARCSPQHYEKLNVHNWWINSKGYPTTTYLGKSIKMHAFVWKIIETRTVPEGFLIDHINTKDINNKLDNRMENLRLLTIPQNGNNKRKRKSAKSKLIGVNYHAKPKKKYHACFSINRKRVRLGDYLTEEKAAEAYDIYVVHNDLVKEGRPLNYENKIEYYKTCQPFEKRKKESQYHGVQKKRKGFKINTGGFKFYSRDEKECALVYDDYVVKNKLGKRLNFPDNYPDYEPEKKIRTHVIYVDENTLKIVFNSGKEAFISNESYEKVKYYSIVHNDYVQIKVDDKTYGLHRYLVGEYNPNILVDHIDGDPFNNRLKNLRRTDYQGNAENNRRKNKYVNIRKKKNGKYETRIENNRIKYSKTHLTEEYAARDRDLQIIEQAQGSLYNLIFKDWNIPGELQKWKDLLANE